jgi:hypothetical protein
MANFGHCQPDRFYILILQRELNKGWSLVACTNSDTSGKNRFLSPSYALKKLKTGLHYQTGAILGQGIKTFIRGVC